jgi:NADP-dependent 3-hydroxy acid dehydrogenase YdfG
MSKVILITGGSSGIGKSIGEYLVERGFKVYGTSRSPEKYSNSKFPILKLDVNNKETISETIKIIIEKEGTLDVLVNNAWKNCQKHK